MDRGEKQIKVTLTRLLDIKNKLLIKPAGKNYISRVVLLEKRQQ